MPREMLAVEVQVMQFQRQNNSTGNWTRSHSHYILENHQLHSASAETLSEAEFNGLNSLAREISHRIASRLWQALIQFYSQRTKGSRHALFVMEKKISEL